MPKKHLKYKSLKINVLVVWNNMARNNLNVVRIAARQEELSVEEERYFLMLMKDRLFLIICIMALMKQVCVIH